MFALFNGYLWHIYGSIALSPQADHQFELFLQVLDRFLLKVSNQAI